MLRLKVIKRRDPRDLSAQPKFYASVKRNQNVGLYHLVDELSLISPINKGDTVSVLINLIELVPKELARGNTVTLGNLGTFWINVSSQGFDNEEEVSPDVAEKVKVHFKASNQLKQLMSNLRYDNRSINNG